MGMLHDPSTEQIKAKLKTPRDPRVVTSHAGVASVNTDGGAKPRQHDCDGDCAGPDNDALNAALDGAPARGVPQKQPTPGQLVAAGVITEE